MGVRHALIGQFLKRVGEANERFQRERHRLASILDGELLQGASLLERSVAALGMYAGGRGGNLGSNMGSRGAGGGGGSFSGSMGSGGVDGMNVPSYAETVAQYAAAHQGQAQSGYIGNRPYTNDGREDSHVLPRTAVDGNPISYREYDVHPYRPGVNRGVERIVIGSDGRRWYTVDHYRTFIQF